MSRKVFYPRCVVLLQVTLYPDTAGGDLVELSIPVIPTMATFTSDDPMTADQASVELPFDQLPFDPRAIADMRIAIFMADVEDPRVDLTTSNTAASRFVGYVDTPAASFSNDRASVHLRARSYEGRLLDTPFGRPVLDAGGPLTSLVRSILAEIPFYAQLPLTVENDASLQSHTGAKRWTPPVRAKVWDVIVALARATGQEAFFDRDALVIRPPVNAGSERTRIVVHGQQIGTFELSTGIRPVLDKAIELCAHDSKSGRNVIGRYPADPALETIRYPVGGDLDAATLKAQAQAIWTTYSRRVVEGSFETTAMSDFEDKDLVSLRAGDAVYVRSWSDDPGYVLGKSAAQLAAFMTGASTPPGIAYSENRTRVDAATADKLAKAVVDSRQVAPLFYVRNCTHTWDASRYSLQVNFENIVGALPNG